MHEQEVIASQTGNLFGGKTPLIATQININKGASIWDLVIPISTLVISFVIGILWAGGYSLFGGTHSFFEALQKNNQTGFILFVASIITLLITLAISLWRKTSTLSALKPVAINGISMMQSSVIMVFLASTFGIMLRQDLHTGIYLAQSLQGVLAMSMLPLLFISSLSSPL